MIENKPVVYGVDLAEGHDKCMIVMRQGNKVVWIKKYSERLMAWLRFKSWVLNQNIITIGD